jgi:hypothetical protein
MDRWMTIHFGDGRTLKFRFPKQFEGGAAARKLEDTLKQASFAVEADGSLYIIPTASIRYLTVTPGPDKLPETVVRGAQLLS